jgi:Right handed beta helix region
VLVWTLTGSSGTTHSSASAATAVAAAPATGAGVHVSTSAGLLAALAAARPGTQIVLANGAYSAKQQITITTACTAARPCSLTGSRSAILDGLGLGKHYGLHLLNAPYWTLTGFRVTDGSKGVVLDTSSHVTIDNLEVDHIGDEAVHFRWCSTEDVLKNSTVHDTGLKAPQYGEGVYVGSANSNWHSYHCTDGRDNSERALIANNTFRHIAAEGADLKEGTDSGTLKDNVFDDAGYSGKNSADSVVDAKGDNWLIEGNTAQGPQGSDLDAFQSHVVYTGYGTGNVFSANKVLGSWPGYGFALSAQGTNVVKCDNTAPGAAKGLVGVNGQPAACTR